MTVFCMMCGNSKPDNISAYVFHSWSCPDCGNVICTPCAGNMEAVGKSAYCTWWNCKSNQHVKITVKEQFEKPIKPQPYELTEGEIIHGNQWYVEINVNGEWQPVDCLGFKTSSPGPEMNHISGMRGERMRMITRPGDVYAEFEVPMDTKNWEFLVNGTLVRASFKFENQLKTMFQGWIYKVPTFSAIPNELTTFHVEAIEGQPPEPSRSDEWKGRKGTKEVFGPLTDDMHKELKERHYIDLEAMRK